MARLLPATLRARLLLVVLLTLLPALGLALFAFFDARGHDRSEARQNALQITRLTAASEAHLIEGAHQLLGALAELPVVRHRDPAGCSALLAQLLPKYPDYANLGVAAPDGEI